MADIVNLRSERKQRIRREEADRAAANRVKFGRTKQERAAAAALEEQARRQHDAHRRDPAPPPYNDDA